MQPYQFQQPTEVPGSKPALHPTEGRPSSVIAKLMAALVTGCGMLNLISLLGGPVPTGQPEWLRDLFPLDFSGLSRTLTLFAGFALILAAMQLWKGKKRAYQLSLALALGSILFHLTKGWNVEEAVFSGLVAILLLLLRRHFPFGASRPMLGKALLRAAGALLLSTVYGALGFWFLETGEFHRNFHWWEAASRSVRIMLLWGDQGLAPHTPYAAWFLDSLYWLSAATFLYAGMVLFRPVAYKFRANRSATDLAGGIAKRYGNTAQDFFKQWPDKSHFFSQSRQTFLAYRVSGHYALVLGDPVGPTEELLPTVVAFRKYCREQGWRLGFHQVSASQLPLYEGLGFRRFKVGDDAIVDLDQFTLQGSAMKEFRNTVNRLDRLGFRIERHDAPLSEQLLGELRKISDLWLDIPGHREREFTLGKFEAAYVRSTPVYVAYDFEQRAVAFLNLVPSYQPGLETVDLMRRRPDVVNGLMDYLFAKVFLDLQTREVHRFSLGMAPLSQHQEVGQSPVEERLVQWALQRMPFLFRADSLRRFKSKYATEWKPLYAVYERRTDLPRLALALRRLSEQGGEKQNRGVGTAIEGRTA